MHLYNSPAPNLGARRARKSGQCSTTRTWVRPQAVATSQKQPQAPGSSSSSPGVQAEPSEAPWWAVNVRLPWASNDDRNAEQVQQALKEASKQQQQSQQAQFPDISRYLQRVDDQDILHLRMASSLCALTYHMPTLTPRSLWRRHRLELSASSLACERLVYEHPRSTQEVLDEADGMGVSLLEAAAMRAPELLQEEGGMGSSTGLAPLGSSTTSSSRSGGGAALAAKEGEDAAAGGGLPLWAGDLVAAKLAEAAAMASAVALQPLASAAGSLYSSGLGLVAGAFAAQQAGGNAASAERLAVATLATVTAVEASVAPHPAGGSHLAAQGEQGACPSEWFVADAAVQGVRYFVIQGSDSLDHWKTNLTFDPVVFEDARLGVKVHRGVYEAAEALYARYLPLVQEWVDTQPAAQVCFIGHSIGGSMATLLMMMYRLRGVLTPHQIAPSVTFGAPAVFVDGSAGHCNCGGSAPDCHVCNGAGAAGASAAAGSQVAGVAQQGLLRGLGLRESHVINVTMARDIVPRAFTCDYSLVADLLRTWGPGFKAHCCLAREGRKHLYHFVGRVLVLQPSEALRFAGPEPRHPMLPAASDLLLLAAPAGGGLVAEMRTAAQRAATLREGGCCSASEPGSVTEAVWALMDNPHPLDILGGAGSYGNDGAISRYHNPDNYTRALGRLCAERRAAAHKALLAPPRVPALAAQRLQLGGTLTAAGAQQSAAQSAGC